MTDYKIFTEDEFRERVKLFWDLMIKPEFPEWECIPIEFSKTLQRVYAYASGQLKDGKGFPVKFRFSTRMADGRFTLDSVDNNIKHEIAHQLALLRHNSHCGHDHRWKKIMVEFGMKPDRTNNYDRSHLSESMELKEHKYYLICDNCGKTYRYKRKTRIIKTVLHFNNAGQHCACGKCRKDNFTLYHFPKGIIAETEVDYELYYNMFGGTKIISKNNSK